MLEKQNQHTGDNSTAIQVQGDFIVTPYHEIRTIFMDLFRLNFPKIQEVAQQKAQERFESMLETLSESFRKHQNNIDPDKFSEPFVQYEMQGMAVDVARRGEKSNVELLCELLCTIVSKDCPELIELIAGEARRVLPILSKKHISYLSLEVIVNEGKLINPDLSVTEKFVGELLTHIGSSMNITNGDLQYISCTGATIPRASALTGIVPIFISKIPVFKNQKIEYIIKYCYANHIFNIVKLLNLMNTCKIGSFTITAIGRLIGWLNLGQFSQVDIKELF